MDIREIIKDFLISEQGLNFMLEVSSTPRGGDVDDGPRYHYGNRKTYEKKSKEMAEKLGFKVIDYIINDGELEIHNTTEPPSGPPLAVSFFPAGDPGSRFFGTNYLPDLQKTPAFREYALWVKKIAMKAGEYFVDFVDAELAKEEEPVKEF